MKPTIQLQFPYPVVSLPLAAPIESLPKLVALCYAEMRADPHGEHFSNKGGWQSGKYVLKKPEMEPLLAAVVEGSKRCIGSLPLTRHDFVIDTAWINISPRGAFNCTHVHAGSLFSGVLYLQSAGVDSGPIVFDCDMWRGREMMSYTEEARNSHLLWPSYVYPPNPGMMIVFPSALPHYVEVNSSELDRISVSFNIDLV